MVFALIKNDIDAFIVFEPAPSIAQKEIDDLTIFAPNDLYGETWNMVVMKDADKETTEKFLKALIQAEDFFRDNKQESLNIVSKYTNTEPEILIEIMKKQNYGLVLNNMLTDYLKEEAEWAINQGLSSNKNIPNYLDFIDTRYLEELKPNRVTI